MKEIVSRQQLKTDLLAICEKNGFKGPLATLIASVSSTTYYNIISRGMLLSREMNINTAVNYNSLIALAMKRMYSVFRGTNPKLTLTGTTSKAQTLHRGDLVYSGPDFNLYVENDVDLILNKFNDIPLVASPAYHYLSKYDNPNEYYIEFRTGNLSEDFILYKEEDQEGDKTLTRKDTTTNFREHIQLGTIFDLTIQDFGIRFYEKSLEDKNAVLSVFEYLDNGNQLIEDFVNDNASDLQTTIKGFIPQDLFIKEYAAVRESKNEIRNHYAYQLNTIYLIRSNSDVLETFNLKFIQYVFDSTIVTYNSEGEIPNFAKNNRLPKYTTSYPLTIVYYSPRSKSAFISADQIEEFAEEIRYFNVGNIISACIGRGKFLNMVLTIVRATDSALEDVKDLLDSYNGKFGSRFSISRIRSDIDRLDSVQGVSEFKVEVFEDKDVTSTGYWQDGIHVEDVDYDYYEFSAKPFDKIRVSGSNPTHQLINFFNDRNELVGSIEAGTTYNEDYPVPANTSIVRVSLLKGNNLVQLGTDTNEIRCENYQYISINAKINVSNSWT